MKTSPFQLVAYSLCIACACLGLPSPAHAVDGINRLINVAHQKASDANDKALPGVEKQRDLIREKQKIRDAQAELEGPASQEGDTSPASHAGSIVQAVAAVVELESKASVDGLDAAELESLAELVGVAQQRVDAATADASTAITSAKQQLKETQAADEKARIKLHLKSLRATVKAHKQTAAALRAVAKKLAA